jgi:hypothetical protein
MMADLHAEKLRLTGQPFFVTHDEHTGRPRSRLPRVFELGLTGTRPAEVPLGGRVRLADPRLTVTPPAFPLRSGPGPYAVTDRTTTSAANTSTGAQP